MRTLAALTATLTALAGLVVAGPAADALVKATVTLYSAQITVHTHNSQAWHFDLAVNPNGDGTDEFRETILRSQSKPVPTTEDHEWFDSIPTSSLSFDNT